MSYWVSFEGVEGRDLSRNYTTNVSPMWTAALDRGATLAETIEATPRAGDLAPILLAAMTRMGNDPARYTAMNPANGWGDFDGAFEYLARIHAICLRWPNATVHVSR